jgi:MltA-interacting protein MipA
MTDLQRSVYATDEASISRVFERPVHPAGLETVVTNRRRDPSGDVNNNRVENLLGRGSSFELGVKGGYVVDFDRQVRANSYLDRSRTPARRLYSSGYEGFMLTPSVTIGVPLSSRWTLTAGVEGSYASDNCTSHYFNNNASEAAGGGLDNYDTDVDFKVGAAVELVRMWAKREHHIHEPLGSVGLGQHPVGEGFYSFHELI